MFCFDYTKLDHSASILTLDFNSIEAAIFIDAFSSHHALPGSSKYKVIVAMFHDEDGLLDFHTVDIHRNIMTDTNETITSGGTSIELLEITGVNVGIEESSHDNPCFSIRIY